MGKDHSSHFLCALWFPCLILIGFTFFKNNFDKVENIFQQTMQYYHVTAFNNFQQSQEQFENGNGMYFSPSAMPMEWVMPMEVPVPMPPQVQRDQCVGQTPGPRIFCEGKVGTFRVS